MSGERAGDLPVITPGELDAGVGQDGRVAGVLLAAGTSSRFGAENKLLATLSGEPLVRAAGETLAASDCAPLVAVLGCEADRVRDALSGIGYRFVRNPAFEQGQATSVRTGVEALGGVDAAVFTLGDMPHLAAASVDTLLWAYRADCGTALAAACEGERGNPVLFDAVHFDALADVTGDVGGREVLLEGEASALVETGDPGVLRDVDTREDLARARRDRRE